MDADSFTKEQKRILYKMADAQVSKTGKTKGSFSYDDYKDHVSPEEFKQIKDLQGGKVGMGSGIANGYSAGYGLAATTGSANFTKDKKSGKILITDEYDFLNKQTSNKDGSFNKDYLKDRTDTYGVMRREAAHRNADTKKKTGGAPINPYSVELNPADTVQTSAPKKIGKVRSATALGIGQTADAGVARFQKLKEDTKQYVKENGTAAVKKAKSLLQQLSDRS